MKEKMLQGKVVAVTGASRGIGRQVALTLAGEGADLIINGMNLGCLEDVRSEVEACGQKCVIAEGDVALPETARRRGASTDGSTYSSTTRESTIGPRPLS